MVCHCTLLCVDLLVPLCDYVYQIFKKKSCLDHGNKINNFSDPPASFLTQNRLFYLLLGPRSTVSRELNPVHAGAAGVPHHAHARALELVL